MNGRRKSGELTRNTKRRKTMAEEVLKGLKLWPDCNNVDIVIMLT